MHSNRVALAVYEWPSDPPAIRCKEEEPATPPIPVGAVITPHPAVGLSPAPQMKLLDRVRWHLRVKHYSLRTETAYIDWIRRFVLFHGKRHPRDLAEPEIAAFLSHLAINRRVAASTQNQHVKLPLRARSA